MAQLPQAFSLRLREQPTPPRGSSFAPLQAHRLWLAVRLGNLVLRSMVRDDNGRSLAIVEPGRQQLRVVAVNERARASGIKPGFGLAAAMALSESLEALERSPEAERRCLEELAAWAHSLTPLVSLAPPDSLLLEVRGSLKLFGGLAALQARLAEELAHRGFSFELCAAPTPLAALWLARHGSTDVLEASALAARLGGLPLRVTGWPEAVLSLLAEMGARNVGDCLRLPRDGFARRVGPGFLQELDKALGRLADLRVEFETEQGLSRTIEFSEETASTEVFARALEAVVAEITVTLRRLQRRARTLQLAFHHLHRPATLSRIELVEPAHETARLLDPLSARLESIALPAPVVALALSVDELVAMQAETAELFTDPEASAPDSTSAAALIEHLRGRFGIEKVYGLELVAEYRPERAWSKSTERLLQSRNRTAEPSPWAHDRPLWILPEPLPLARGIAELGCTDFERAAVERIESGWWDGEDIRRDYYVVSTSQGERLWAYRDCATSHWYLHGIFG